MNTFDRISAVATLLLGATIGATNAHAYQVLTIPYTEALPADAPPEHCINDQPYQYHAEADLCHVVFPIEIPAGHIIHQIGVFHSTNGNYPQGGYIQAWLDVYNLPQGQASSNQQKFLWTAFNDIVPTGTAKLHPLMAQFGTNFYDEFSVDPFASYRVVVGMQWGESVQGIRIVYD